MKQRAQFTGPFVVAGTCIGHKGPDAPNQDACSARCSDSGLVVAAVADGVGSLRDSHFYSEAAVAGVIDAMGAVSEFLVAPAAPSATEPTPLHGFVPGLYVTQDGASSWHRITVADKATPTAPRAQPRPLPLNPGVASQLHRAVRRSIQVRLDELEGVDGATTLLYAIVSQERVYWARVGDGAIALASRNDNGFVFLEMEDKLYTATDVLNATDVDKSNWAFGTASRADLKYLALLTDGISDVLDDPQSFCDFLSGELGALDTTTAQVRLAEILGSFPPVHYDDKTLIFVGFSPTGDQQIDFTDDSREAPANA